ncbi:MAG: putative OxPP cycle protein opcA [Frankiales bacterium]|jgi:glucose-6-phosphate dehydrogenase assembly protein OpcA|nr:putative OxPP cycle protein opcA [Frankiales bacterium]
MTTLWDTSGTAVITALSAERRAAGSVSSGLALTMVAVVDEKLVAEAEQAATAAAAQHPCRLLMVVRRRPDAPEPRLDAEVSVGGRLGPGEAIVMRMYGRLALHAESVVLPLLAPDAPVVTWWFGEPPHLIAHDPLGVIADRRITDAAAATDPSLALGTRADDYAPGDTDLAWTRTTLWRSLCASAYDSLSGDRHGATVSGEAGNPSRALLAGWLEHRLGCSVVVEDSTGPGVTGVGLRVGDDKVTITRNDGRTATLSRTGQPDRAMPLPRRELGDLLAEELRRLDADETYAESLETVTGLHGLSARSPKRTHVWQDPMEANDPDPALTTT